MSKKRLSSFTVKEIGAAIKPGLEKMIESSLKPLEAGKITHVNDTEIVLDGFKVEVSDDVFIPSNAFLKGLTVGFLLGLIALPLGYAAINWAANKWRDKNALATKTVPKPTAVSQLLKKPVPVKTAAPASVTPASSPTPTKPVSSPPPTSDITDDLTDTLSPSGLPMQPPTQPPELNDADFEN
jgi:hypothetical protein